MSTYADASFIVSAFGGDSNTPHALSWLRGFTSFIWVSRLTLFEAENALRWRVGAGQMDTAEFQSSIKRVAFARQRGLIVRRELSPHQWFPQAHRISAHDQNKTTARALDILHVSAAILLSAEAFLSFDDRQRTLAMAEGLDILP